MYNSMVHTTYMSTFFLAHRVNDETLPSSVVVFEALEYIRKLKGVLDIHDIADRITEFDDLYDDR